MTGYVIPDGWHSSKRKLQQSSDYFPAEDYGVLLTVTSLCDKPYRSHMNGIYNEIGKYTVRPYFLHHAHPGTTLSYVTCLSIHTFPYHTQLTSPTPSLSSKPDMQTDCYAFESLHPDFCHLFGDLLLGKACSLTIRFARNERKRPVRHKKENMQKEKENRQMTALSGKITHFRNIVIFADAKLIF